MVAVSSYQAPITQDAPHLPQAFNWASISVQSVFDSGLRLEASVYATDAQKAKQLIAQCKYGAIPVNQLVESCVYPGRFKRVYLPKKAGLKGFIGSAEMLALNPEPVKWMLPQPETSIKKVNYCYHVQGQLVMSVS
jgi:hypothetical protein